MDRKSQILEFLKESPQDAFLNYALAQEHIGAGNDAEAEEIFRHLLLWHPNYVATYYHLGKLLERKQEVDAAKEMYKNGIEVAKSIKEQHALSELQSALLELEYD
ncbi:MAG: hypothetical protein IT244_09595 [Bacteroidia bacterium]|jgi:tetratricopeptide (TPR) repeat protein|nr:hypothetical protein [Bacteroidia bacterium]